MHSKFFHHFALWTVLSALVGCSFQSGEAPSSGTESSVASFAVETVESVGKPIVEELNGEWAFALRSTYRTRICLRDRATGEALVGESFRVDEQSRVTDVSGCLLVSKSVDFHWLETEKFYPVEIHLAHQGGLGSLQIPLALNPWNSSLLDQREGRDFPVARENLPSPSLVVLSAKIAPENWKSTGGSTNLSFLTQFSFATERNQIDGNRTLENLKRGKFSATLTLFEMDENNQTHFLAEGLFQAEVTAGVTSPVPVALNLKQLPQKTSHLKWQIRFSPLGEEKLPVWEGELEAQKLSDTAEARPRVQKEEASVVYAPPVAAERTEGHGFYPSSWRLLPGGNIEVDGATYRGKTQIFAEVCVKDSINDEPIVHHPFKLSLVLEGVNPLKASEEVLSDSRGCVQPGRGFEATFHYFQTERYLPGQLKIESATDPYSSVERVISVHLNPWRNSPGEFFWDSSLGAPPSPKGDVKTKLQLMDVSYHYPPQKDDFQLDAHLNLSQREVFFMTLVPKVFRPFAVGGSRSSSEKLESLEKGMKLRVRVLFTATHVNGKPSENSYDHLRLLSTYEVESSVDGRGMLTIPVAVAYDFAEQALLESNTQVYLEVSPVSSEGPEAITVEAPMDLLRTYEHGFRPVEASLSLDQIESQLVPWGMRMESLVLSEEKLQGLSLVPTSYTLRKPRAVDVQSPWELFQSRFRLPKNVSNLELERKSEEFGSKDEWPSELNANRLGPQELGSLASEGSLNSSTLASICKLYFLLPFRGNPGMYSQCLSNPQGYLRLDRFSFVEEVLSKPTKLWGRTHDIEVHASVYQEQAETEKESKGHSDSHDIDLGVTAKVGYEQFGNGVTAHATYAYRNKWFKTTSRSTSHASKDRVRIREKRPLIAAETAFELNLRLKNCVLIKLRRWMKADYLTATGRQERSYLVCYPEEKRVEDSWFFITDKEPSHLLERSGRGDLRHASFLRLLRGQENFQDFKRSMEDTITELTLTEVPIFRGGVDRLLSRPFEELQSPFGFFRDGGKFPGVLRHRSLLGE